MALTAKRLKKILVYSKTTGKFRFLGKNGWIEGWKHPKGYRSIKIDGTLYLAHRLAWLYVVGKWPHQIDHKNRKPHDNRFSNLRECTSSQNNHNRGMFKNNSSGFSGVSWRSRDRKWIAYVRINNKLIRLGLFANKRQAAQARNK